MPGKRGPRVGARAPGVRDSPRVKDAVEQFDASKLVNIPAPTAPPAVHKDFAGPANAPDVALAAMLSGRTRRQAAQLAGVHVSVLDTWMQPGKPLRIAYDKARQEYLQTITSDLRLAARVGLETLVKAAEDGHIGAATELLRLLPREDKLAVDHHVSGEIGITVPLEDLRRIARGLPPPPTEAIEAEIVKPLDEKSDGN